MSKSDHRHAIAASFLGWTLDAFDFFLVVFVLTDIGKEFGKTRTEMAGAIAITLAMRPVGAFIFGLLADRYGRRIPLMIDLVFFSVIEVLSGLATSYTQFMVLRALFGIGMGGEWGVGASLAMEKAPKGRRGFLSGLLQEGYATGQLLAALCYLFVFPHVGWRAMFFIGGLPAFLAIYIRMNVKESEVWQKVKVDNWAHLGRAILSHWKTFLSMFAMMTAMGLVSHGTQDMYPNFLKEYHHYSPTMVAYITICYSVGAIFGGLVMGHLSDTIGRKRAMVISLLLACLAVPLWAYAQSLPLLILGAFVLQFMVQGAWGIVPAHVNELSPDAVRGFLPGFAYQCGIAVAGMITVLQSALADRMDYAHAMALCAVAVFLIGAIAVSLGKEKHAIEFGGG